MVVEDFFTPEELDPCKTSINSLVDFLAEKLYRGGKIKSKFIRFQNSYICIGSGQTCYQDSWLVGWLVD